MVKLRGEKIKTDFEKGYRILRVGQGPLSTKPLSRFLFVQLFLCSWKCQKNKSDTRVSFQLNAGWTRSFRTAS